MIYEIFYSLQSFKISNYYILHADVETTQTFRGTVSDKDGNSFGRFVLNKNKILCVDNGIYGRKQGLRTYIIASNEQEALSKARRLFSEFFKEKLASLNE